jgi:hypothetical protein
MTIAIGAISSNISHNQMKNDIRTAKRKLIAKAKKKGLWENFGQKEVRKLVDEYGYTDEVERFDNWAMTFDERKLREVI